MISMARFHAASAPKRWSRFRDRIRKDLVGIALLLLIPEPACLTASKSWCSASANDVHHLLAWPLKECLATNDCRVAEALRSRIARQGCTAMSPLATENSTVRRTVMPFELESFFGEM